MANDGKNEAMIRVVDLYKNFGMQPVLKGVTLEFFKGKITTIVGTSGCGKTVLLKHLNALLRPDRGQVIVDSLDITKLAQKELYEVRSRFGVLFQGAALLDSMTVFDNVAFPLREKTNMDEEEIGKKVEERLDHVGLEGMGHKFPAELSGGMRKRRTRPRPRHGPGDRPVRRAHDGAGSGSGYGHPSTDRPDARDLWLHRHCGQPHDPPSL
jgi:ABC-type transporter Mla maintaining outer membrane lipid asymmetry ATPase subunit MlaF